MLSNLFVGYIALINRSFSTDKTMWRRLIDGLFYLPFFLFSIYSRLSSFTLSGLKC